MLGAIVICVILLALEVEYSETRRHESNIAKTLYHLISSDESSSSSSSSSQDSEELRKGIDKYLKHICKSMFILIVSADLFLNKFYFQKNIQWLLQISSFLLHHNILFFHFF
ncbi:hypothetical protein O3G_MSEX013204 [Manduca sexta]|uniref:Uncharacterized protein n=1 Tax=Manduca sexta TaxID=7130 RepID=A0A922CXV8_MANSE|nr:hypothetical protein O3G_MSEX013204 [Manduca sexta]